MFFKERLRRGDETLQGVVCVIPSAVTAQAIAAAGADFIIIDREHGSIDRETVHTMVTATAGTACAALVRVPAIDEAQVKVALDAGAEGIVYPQIRSPEDARRCAAYVTYPPDGSRGWGPFLAHSRYGTAIGEYSSAVGPHVTCSVLIETTEAVDQIDAIVATPGLDLVFLAPFDLSMALGVEGQFDAPVFTEAIEVIERAANRAGIPLGGIGLTREQSAALVAKGHRAIVNGLDVFMLKDGVATFKTWH